MGFKAAYEYAREKAREHKVLWRALTGETYGEKKAADWKPKVEGNIDAIRDQVIDKQKQLSEINDELERLNQKYGALQALAVKSIGRHDEIKLLRAQSEKIERIKAKLENDERDLKSWQAMVEKTRQATHGIGPDDSACHCPECKAELIFIGKDKKLVSHGDLRGSEDAAVNLPQYESNLTLFINSVNNGRRDLAIAERARDKLAELEKEVGEAVDEEMIKLAKEAVDVKRAQRKELDEIIAKLIAHERELAKAEDNLAQAMEYHTKVMDWERIADALAPDGIPGEILLDAIKPFNDRMLEQSLKAGWKKPWVNQDMEIMVDELPYCLMSESAKWRADTLLAEAISHVSGLKLLVLDRCDVLDGKSRGGLFVWLTELAMLNEVDTALVMGTLKQDQSEIVAQAFDNVCVNWMENGVLESVRTNKEVAA